jgi:hypothetical protein
VTSTAASYVFGVVPGDAEAPAPEESGLGADLRLVRHGDLAALVGSVPVDRSLGRAADLRAHDRVLAGVVAAGIPVLPMRFGAVMTDDEAVADELLAPHSDEFLAGLAAVSGHVQYTVRVTYEQDAVLREILAAHPEIEALRSGPGAQDPATMRRQVRLGELVVRVLEELRPTDAAAVLDDLHGAADVRVRTPGSPDDVLDAAFLVPAESADAFENRVEDAGRRRAERLRFRLVGPSPAYDFVGSA